MKSSAPTDVPRAFHCEFFASEDNVETVARSKAVGEPPLMHAICVWSAVRHALRCVAPDRRIDLKLPATGEEILRCLTALEPAPASRRPAATESAIGNGAPPSPRPLTSDL